MNIELSSHEETRFEFNRSTAVIKSAEGRIPPVCGLGIDVHQDFYVVGRAKGETRLMHYVYLLRSARDDAFYIGYTSNLRIRLRQHAEGNSFATSHRGPWKLIYYEAYLEQAEALGREKYLKRGAGRRFRFLQSQLKNYLRKQPSKQAA